VVNHVLLDSLRKVDEESRGDDDDLNAVKTAIEFEAKGAKYYAQLRDNVSDEREKQFFDLLSRIENEHYLSLRETEEYLSDPASWYQKVEHHGLDGA